MRRGLGFLVAAIFLSLAAHGCSLMEYCPMHVAMRALTKKSDPPAPAEAAAEAAAQQTACPVMGGKIDQKIYTDHKGTRVYFCCPGCIDTFKKDPEKYVAKLK